jgi:hypothetical protein
MDNQLYSLANDYIMPGVRLKSPFGVDVHSLCINHAEAVKANLSLPRCQNTVAFTSPSLSFGELIDPDCRLMKITKNGFQVEEFAGDVLLVKDVVTEGETTRHAIEFLEARGNPVTLLCCMVNFGKAQFKQPFVWLLDASRLSVSEQRPSSHRRF